MKARWLAVVLLLALGVSGCGEPTPEAHSAVAIQMQGPGVGVGQVRAASGERAEVPLQLADVTNLGSLHVELTYDAQVLRPVEVQPGALYSGGVFDKNMATPGRVVIGLASSQGITGSGEVAVVTFDVIGQTGATSALNLENVEASDATTLAAMPLPVQSGSLEVGALDVVGGRSGEPQNLMPWLTGGGTGTLLCASMLILMLAVAIIWYVGRGRQAAPAAGGGQLWVTKGSATPSTLKLDKDVVTLGRDPGNDMALHDDQASRQHAQIRQEAGGPVLYDLNSTNGTFVNAERVSAARPLHNGDRIGIGSTEIAYGE